MLSRKSTILLTIYCDKHWDMLLVVLLIRIWQGKGGLDILWKMKGNTLPPRRPSEISELIGTVCPLLKANLCLLSLLSLSAFPKVLEVSCRAWEHFWGVHLYVSAPWSTVTSLTATGPIRSFLRTPAVPCLLNTRMNHPLASLWKSCADPRVQNPPSLDASSPFI